MRLGLFCHARDASRVSGLWHLEALFESGAGS
jgi:hypothetical protein